MEGERTDETFCVAQRGFGGRKLYAGNARAACGKKKPHLRLVHLATSQLHAACGNKRPQHSNEKRDENMRKSREGVSARGDRIEPFHIEEFEGPVCKIFKDSHSSHRKAASLKNDGVRWQLTRRQSLIAPCFYIISRANNFGSSC